MSEIILKIYSWQLYQENIARIEKSPLQVKGEKFWPKLSTYRL